MMLYFCGFLTACRIIIIFVLQGVGPTAQRAAVIAAVELPVYDLCKHRLMGVFGNHVSNHFM